MTYQEALNYLNNAQVGMKSIESVCEASDLIETCKKSLETLIPKKPTGNKLNCCPSCKRLVGINTDIIHAKYNYCKYCGQAIDWSELNEKV